MSVYEDQEHAVYDEQGNYVETVLITTDVTEDANKAAIVTNLEQDLLVMQAILDDTNANINDNPAAAIKDIARMCKRLGRTAIKDYTEAD